MNEAPSAPRAPAKVDHTKHHQYWKINLIYLRILLAVWFLVSYVCSIILVDDLDQIKIAGFPLGFWFSQQGSIYVFVILIFVYAWLMNRLDHRFDVDEA